MSAQAASARRICSSVRQFLINSTFVLDIGTYLWVASSITSTNVLLIRNWRWPGASCSHFRWQQFSAWNDVMADILKLSGQIENPTWSVGAYLREVHSNQSLSLSDLKRRSRGLVEEVVSTRITRRMRIRWEVIWDQFLIEKNTNVRKSTNVLLCCRLLIISVNSSGLCYTHVHCEFCAPYIIFPYLFCILPWMTLVLICVHVVTT